MKKGSDTFEDDLRRKKNRELENNDKSGKDQDSQGTIRDYRDFEEKSQDDSDFEKRKDTKPPAEEPPCCDIPMQVKKYYNYFFQKINNIHLNIYFSKNLNEKNVCFFEKLKCEAILIK